MHAWIGHAERLLKSGEAVVLVTVARAEGSTPREPGARMLVTREGQWLTIGGGNLEWRAADVARGMLAATGAAPRRLERVSLGPSLGQCCGGVATLAFERLGAADLAWLSLLGQRLRAGRASRRSVLMEEVVQQDEDGRVAAASGAASDEAGDAATRGRRAGAVEGPDGRLEIDDVPAGAAAAPLPPCSLREEGTRRWLVDIIRPPDFHVFLFGAGHVGQALVRILATLPCTVSWVDERDAQFPADAPANVEIEATDTPEAVIADAPRGSYFLVMTHSHALDQHLCHHILQRGDYAYFGLIGSRTKRRKFEHRLQARGVSAAQLARMVCPIGVSGIRGKAPEIIAVAVAAQLLQVYERTMALGPHDACEMAATAGIMASCPATASMPDALTE
ncbi:xanthine dehydrogenase accessory protein XdhC [Parapusillimonas sp. SGNA-6]|nr:xanthine dehydrogenase accessory protein XdhC [Parapusillimonas sp. SGNA-6]